MDPKSDIINDITLSTSIKYWCIISNWSIIHHHTLQPRGAAKRLLRKPWTYPRDWRGGGSLRDCDVDIYSISRMFMIFYSILLYFMVFYGILLYFMVYCGILWYFMVFYGILLYSMVFCCILWYFVVFYVIFLCISWEFWAPGKRKSTHQTRVPVHRLDRGKDVMDHEWDDPQLLSWPQRILNGKWMGDIHECMVLHSVPTIPRSVAHCLSSVSLPAWHDWPGGPIFFPRSTLTRWCFLPMLLASSWPTSQTREDLQSALMKNEYWIFIHSYIPSIMYTFIYSYIHSYIHTYIHSYIHTIIHSYIHTFLQ